MKNTLYVFRASFFSGTYGPNGGGGSGLMEGSCDERGWIDVNFKCLFWNTVNVHF